MRAGTRSARVQRAICFDPPQLLRQRVHVNNAEARSVLAAHLAALKARTYSELAQLVDEGPTAFEVDGPSGATYQIEIVAVWDAGEAGDVHVIGSIDDGGLRAFVPLTDDFIMSPAGTFLGE